MTNRELKIVLTMSLKVERLEDSSFEEFLELLPVACYLVSLKGVLKDYNREFCHVLGLDPGQDHRGMKVPELWIKGSEREIYIGRLLKEGMIRNYNVEGNKINGDPLFIRINASVIRDGEGRPESIRGTFIDITEQSLTEKSLKQSQQNNLFLANTILELFNASSEEEIYNYVVEKLFQIINGKGIITYAAVDMESRNWTILASKMLPSVLTTLSGLLGFDFTKFTGTLNDEQMQQIPEGTLVKYDFDYARLTGGKIPDKLGKILKKMLSMDELYCISANYNDQIFGNFTIITTEKNLQLNARLIEAFIAQVNLFIRKIRTEKALQASENYFRSLFQQAAVGVAIVDTRTGQYRSINRKHYEILGYTEEELIPYDFMKISHPDDIALDLGQMKKLIKGEINSFTLEKRYIKKNGETVWVKLNVSPLWKEGEEPRFHIAVIEDITDRKIALDLLEQRNDDLFQSSERYKALILSSNTGAWEYSRDEDYLWCSPEYFSMLGYDHRKFNSPLKKNLNMNWLELLHPADRELASSIFQDYLRNPEGMYENFFRMKHKNGEWIWICSRGRILEDEEGNWTGLTVGTHINITQLKEVEKQLVSHKINLEKLVKERTSELEEKNNELRAMNEELHRFNDLFVNREFRIKELKDEIEQLKSASL